MFFRDAARYGESLGLWKRLYDSIVTTKHNRSNHISARAPLFWPETLKILSTEGQISTDILHQPDPAPTAKSVTGGRKNSLCFWKSPLSDLFQTAIKCFFNSYISLNIHSSEMALFSIQTASPAIRDTEANWSLAIWVRSLVQSRSLTPPQGPSNVS